MSNLVRLQPQTIAEIRAKAHPGESMDATVRRLAGLQPIRAAHGGRTLGAAAQAMADMAPGAVLTLPWLLTPEGELLIGQAAYTQALGRLERSTGRTFVEIPSHTGPGGGYTIKRLT